MGGATTERLNSVEDFLAHYGVKGMKWGTRRLGSTKTPPSADASRVANIKAKAKTGKVKALTNAELQDAINRMNLEQQFKRLKTNERNIAVRFIASTLQEIGTQEAKKLAVKTVTGGLAKRKKKES